MLWGAAADAKITTGVRGGIVATVHPTAVQPGTKAKQGPAESVEVQVLALALALDKDAIVGEAKMDQVGRYQISLPAGDYSFQVVNGPKSYAVKASILPAGSVPSFLLVTAVEACDAGTLGGTRTACFSGLTMGGLP